MAGALGNILDSAFYGLIFSESSYHTVATLFPPEGGYNSFLHGKVVDMFYFPVVDTILPEWVPFRGGERFIFFRPVFNIADASITSGVFMLLIFQKRFFAIPEEEKGEEVKAEEVKQEENQDKS
jgi:signal peptidase II